MTTVSEENYLKSIYTLSAGAEVFVNTNQLATHFGIAPASVTDMLKKMAVKKWIIYKAYKGAYLSSSGLIIALQLIRKHRLWEYFLSTKLGFQWSEVHDIAEELEHINSTELINRLAIYLGKPKHDPHGDPIPDENGCINNCRLTPLSKLKCNETSTLKAVSNQSKLFLESLNSQGIQLNSSYKITSINAYDQSMQLENSKKEKIYLSQKMSENLLMKKNKKNA